MVDSITISVISIPDGTQSTITLTKTGDDTGTIELGGQTFDLTNITASANGLKLKCNGPFGSDITATIQPGNPAFITVEITGTIFFDSTKHYQTSSADQQRLTQFIIDAHFPPLR